MPRSPISSITNAVPGATTESPQSLHKWLLSVRKQNEVSAVNSRELEVANASSSDRPVLGQPHHHRDRRRDYPGVFRGDVLDAASSGRDPARSPEIPGAA